MTAAFIEEVIAKTGILKEYMKVRAQCRSRHLRVEVFSFRGNEPCQHVSVNIEPLELRGNVYLYFR